MKIYLIKTKTKTNLYLKKSCPKHCSYFNLRGQLSVVIFVRKGPAALGLLKSVHHSVRRQDYPMLVPAGCGHSQKYHKTLSTYTQFVMHVCICIHKHW